MKNMQQKEIDIIYFINIHIITHQSTKNEEYLFYRAIRYLIILSFIPWIDEYRKYVMELIPFPRYIDTICCINNAHTPWTMHIPNNIVNAPIGASFRCLYHVHLFYIRCSFGARDQCIVYQ